MIRIPPRRPLRALLRLPLAYVLLIGLLAWLALWLDLPRIAAALLPPSSLPSPSQTSSSPRSTGNPSWREPAATLAPTPTPLSACRAVDGDTLHCAGVRVRLRGVDTPERDEPRYREAGRALQAMVEACRPGLMLIPHHRSRDRIVGDVLCGGTNLGQAMDEAGWSKPVGARR
jgi:endonuclease YncB( thermonuclease family)